jgi:hypothetical protein
MRDVTDAALQKLYWACRGAAGFPGQIPDESTGSVSTTDILRGMGLVTPDQLSVQGPEGAAQKSPAPKGKPARPVPPAIKSRSTESAKSSTTSDSKTARFDMPAEQAIELSPSMDSVDDYDLDMREQFMVYSTDSLTSSQTQDSKGDQGPPQHAESASSKPTEPEASLTLDNLIDLSFDLSSEAGSQASSYQPLAITRPSPASMSAAHVGPMPTQSCASACAYDVYLPAWHSSWASFNQTRPTIDEACMHHGMHVPPQPKQDAWDGVRRRKTGDEGLSAYPPSTMPWADPAQ